MKKENQTWYRGDLELLHKMRRNIGQRGINELTYRMVDSVDDIGHPSSSVKRHKELINYYRGKDKNIEGYIVDRLIYTFNYRDDVWVTNELDHTIKMGFGDKWIKDRIKKDGIWEVN